MREASVMDRGVGESLVMEDLKAFNKCLLSTSLCLSGDELGAGIWWQTKVGTMIFIL